MVSLVFVGFTNPKLVPAVDTVRNALSMRVCLQAVCSRRGLPARAQSWLWLQRLCVFKYVFFLITELNASYKNQSDSELSLIASPIEDGILSLLEPLPHIPCLLGL